MKRKITFAVTVFACLLGGLLCLTGCMRVRPVPPYYGIYYAEYDNGIPADRITIDSQIHIDWNDSLSVSDYTYGDGCIGVSSTGDKLCLAENDQVLYFDEPCWKYNETYTIGNSRVTSGWDLQQRNGLFRKNLRYSTSDPFEIKTQYEFYDDGSLYIYVNSSAYSRIDTGTYTLVRGVLTIHITESSDYSSATRQDKKRFYYIDERYDIYGPVFIRDYTRFASNGSPDVPDDPNTPDNPDTPQVPSPVLETPDYSFDGDGTAENPYRIETSAQLLGMGAFANRHFVLAHDIKLPTNSENRPNFVPLFSDETPFCGTFDGNGYTVKNLHLYNTETYFTGLFACIGETGNVKNLTLADMNVFGANYIGGIAGLSYGQITDCRVSGSITHVRANDYAYGIGGLVGYYDNQDAVISGCISETKISVSAFGDNPVGGIVGRAAVKEIVACRNSGSISALSGYVGGVCGKTENTCRIIACSNSGLISANGGTHSRVGGLIGEGRNCSVYLSYNTGDITVGDADIIWAGGLVGGEDCERVDKSFNAGNLTITALSQARVGGCVAGAYTVDNSYNVGNVTAAGVDVLCLGGVAGSAYTIDTCYNVGVIVGTGERIGEIVGTVQSVRNSHWLQTGNTVRYGVGLHAAWNVPTNSGTTKHTDMADFYTLAETLNEGLSAPVWENKTATSLPTLILSELFQLYCE